MASNEFEGEDVAFRDGDMIILNPALQSVLEKWWADKNHEVTDPIYARFELQPEHGGPYGSSPSVQTGHKPGHAVLDC